MSILSKLFGTNEGEVSRLQSVVDRINSLEPEYEKLTDTQLKGKTAEFVERHQKGESLDDLLPEAFAVVRESSKRVLGERHYDVQLMGGIILHQGKIAEVKTGEGKTLMATLPLYLNALTGKGAHLVTVNDYLSKVGAGWMGAVYHFLGVTCAYIGHETSMMYDPSANIEEETDKRLKHFRPITRQEAYRADITYGTNNEFGFDYLRDNMAYSSEQLAQREQNFGIVDEVDSILIDEARTPLIISAPAEESADLYSQFANLVPRLKKEEDYTVDEKAHAVSITASGIAKMEDWLGIKNLYEDPRSVSLAHHLEEALKAEVLFRKDKDYVVKDGEVIIVDEFTGRLMPGRRYSEGLHQAIEAKENVEIKRESDTLATISFQNLFRMYDKLAGMTGTAVTEAEEFFKIYKLEVVVVPTNREMVRKDYEDLIYKTEDGKFQAIIKDVKARNELGQPILIGTASIAKSEKLSKLLSREGIKHQILNAKNHEREAKIIAQAGKVGAVTVATNMAGRGVDIILGGAAPRLSEEKSGKSEKEKITEWEKEHSKVLELGGLHVLGSERHEARRIDNQLRGRAGRQGDLGSSQFYVSMEDDLMRIFGGDRLKNMMERLGLPADQAIQHKFISRSIEQAQRKVEGHNFDIRKHLVEYDDVMNKHREVIYRKRRKVLGYGQDNEGNWLHEEILELMDEEEKKSYLSKCTRWGEEATREVEKNIYLRTIDVLWIEHLNTMDELRDSIGLRGYGQRDPLIEYKQEAYNIFQGLTRAIEDQAVEMMLKVDIAPQQVVRPVQVQPKAIEMHGADESLAGGGISREEAAAIQDISEPVAPQMSPPASNGTSFTIRKRGQEIESGNTVSNSFPKVGRNDACPCGSGKKFKKCHGA